MIVSYAAAWRGLRRSHLGGASWRRAVACLQPWAWSVGLLEGRLVAVQIEMSLAVRPAHGR